MLKKSANLSWKHSNKKIAIVASGWHFPLHFYEQLAKQELPEDWSAEMFCIAHRNPNKAHDKDISKLGNSKLENLDKIFYKKIATEEDLKKLGWDYKLYPNTMGDWGCSNQWLEEHDYKEFDLFLFTHDDNFILRDDFIKNAIETNKEWMIITNSTGKPKGWLRGSCEFFKKEMLDLIGGKFDLSSTKLTREGKTDNPTSIESLTDWNSMVVPLMNFIKQKEISIVFLSANE